MTAILAPSSAGGGLSQRGNNLNDDDDNMDNPWMHAALSHGQPVSSRFCLHPTLPGTENNNNILATEAEACEFYDGGCCCCSRYTVQRWLQAWLCLDVIVGIAALTLVGWVAWGSHRLLPHHHTLITLTHEEWLTLLLVALVLVLRALTARIGLLTDLCQRAGLRCSAGLSLLLSAVLLVTAGMLLLDPHAVSRWWMHYHDRYHPHRPELLWLAHHVHVVAMVLLAWGGLEALRAWCWQRQARILLQHDAAEWFQVSPELLTLNPRRPWWWQHRHSELLSTNDDLDGAFIIDTDPLRAALLPPRGGPEWVLNTSAYTPRVADRAPTTSSSSRWWFPSLGSWFQSNNNNSPRGVRDDASVAFASVQEEWATRDEEDPFWWSRDHTDENDHGKGGSNPQDDSPPLQWIRTTTTMEKTPPSLHDHHDDDLMSQRSQRSRASAASSKPPRG